jgi:hypothetical protein
LLYPHSREAGFNAIFLKGCQVRSHYRAGNFSFRHSGRVRRAFQKFRYQAAANSKTVISLHEDAEKINPCKAFYFQHTPGLNVTASSNTHETGVIDVFVRRRKKGNLFYIHGHSSHDFFSKNIYFFCRELLQSRKNNVYLKQNKITRKKFR